MRFDVGEDLSEIRERIVEDSALIFERADF